MLVRYTIGLYFYSLNEMYLCFLDTCLTIFLYLPSLIHLKHFSVYSSAYFVSLLVLIFQTLFLHLWRVKPCLSQSNNFFFILDTLQTTAKINTCLCIYFSRSLEARVLTVCVHFVCYHFFKFHKWGWQDSNPHSPGPKPGMLTKLHHNPILRKSFL